MQRLLRIGSLLSAGYFLASPILFAFHFLHHDICSQQTHERPEGRSVLTDYESSCDVCDLYCENHHTHNIFPLPFLRLPVGESAMGGLQNFITIGVPIYGLRGPPFLLN